VEYEQAVISDQWPVPPKGGKVLQAAVGGYCIIWVK